MHSLKQRGVGMIEILIALLVIAIGLVGVTGMQAVSLKNNVTSLNQANALFLAGSIMDRIRITGGNSGFITDFDDDAPASITSCQGTSSDCDTAAMVKFYVSEWKCQLGGGDRSNCGSSVGILADGQGSIEEDAGTGAYIISIQYSDTVAYNSDGSRATSPETVTMRTVMMP